MSRVLAILEAVSENLKKQLSKLSKRGPHRVLVGDLAYAGMEGKVYTPATGNSIPAVAFGHDWRKHVSAYHGTLRHLASWGIAVAAPDTETGFNPDHRGFAGDLDTALQVLAGVKLGQGNITVGPGKLGIVGHGMGAGAAVLAAAGVEKVRAIAAIYPAVTSPSAEKAAQKLTIPGLVIGSGEDSLLDAGNPPRLAASWRGDVAYREIENGNQGGFSEDILLKLIIGAGKPQTSARETVRGLVTGFLLHQLAGDKKYAAFSAADATAKKVVSFFGDDLRNHAGLEPTTAHAVDRSSLS